MRLILLAVIGIYLGVTAGMVLSYYAHKHPPVRYHCIITVHDEILCFQHDGTMFRPERRFDRFILEVPKP